MTTCAPRLVTSGLAWALAGILVTDGQAQAPPKAGPHFSFSGKRPTFHEDHIERIEVVVSGAASEGRVSIIESYWLPSFSVQSHFHKMHAETFYIMSGRVEWTVGGQTQVMGAGDAVHIPPNTVHSVRVLERMHSLMFYQTGGYEDQVAAEAALTAEQRKDPTIQALLTQLTDFNRVSGPAAAPPRPAGQPDKGVPVVSFRGKRSGFEEADVENIEVVLSGAQTEGRLSIIESRWLPGFSAPAHYHKAHAETFYVLSGQVEWTVGGETHVLSSGDAVHIPPNTLHSVKVVGGAKLHTLFVSEPGGAEESAGKRPADFHVPPR